MTEPCKNEGRLAKVEADNGNQDKTLDTLARTLAENTRLLGTLAEIGSDVRHIREDQARMEGNINTLFSRVRTLELAPGKALSKVALLVITAASGCFGGIVTGLVLWLVKGN